MRKDFSIIAFPLTEPDGISKVNPDYFGSSVFLNTYRKQVYNAIYNASFAYSHLIFYTQFADTGRLASVTVALADSINQYSHV